MKQKISLFDSNFSHHPNRNIEDCGSLSSFPGYDRFPTFFEWDRNNVCDVTVFTDNYIHIAKTINCKTKIAWLLEPRSLCPEIYNNLDKNDFDLILTHDISFLESLGDKGRYYVYGGAWVKDSDMQIYPKTKNISIVASGKNQLPGHKLRHEVIQKLADKYKIDVFGRGYCPLEYILDAYKDYRYTIVIENTNEGIITEKIISPILCGTVPIYWGNDSDTFSDEALFRFNTIDQLEKALKYTGENSESLYDVIYGSIKHNFDIAKRFIICEDNIKWSK